MTTTTTKSNVKAARLIGPALLVLPTVILSSNSLGIKAPAHAQGFPQLEQRGSHGAYRIVNESQPKAPELQTDTQSENQATQQTTSAEDKAVIRQAPIFVPQGSHGAHRVLEQEGVGGPGSLKSRRFPRLERRGSHGGHRIVND